MLLAVACGAQTPKNNSEIDETLPIEQIDMELADMACAIDECRQDSYIVKDSLVSALTDRLEHYLLYPQTYENDMPLLKKQMYISELPVSGNKLYSFGWYEGGTMGDRHNTYIQYRDKSGEVGYIPFFNDLRYPSFFDFYEFCHNSNTYYLVKQFSRGMSCSWYYYIAVISINDGVITYHPEFFPAEFDFKPGIEEYFVYDDNGTIIDNTERSCYFMRVCGTENANTNVGFDFNPTTLTMTVLDDADTTESRTGAVIESKWRLNVEEDIRPHKRGEYDKNTAWIKHLNTLNADDESDKIDVYFKYNKPIDGYEVTMLWHPFDSKGCETGTAIINFRNIATNKSFQYINNEKFNGYHTDQITFAKEFRGYADGDVFYLDNSVPEQPECYETTINYYQMVQFVDVDFDGEKELLISDWGQCQQGNGYEVYDVTNRGLVFKTQPPYDNIDNVTKFHYDNKQIEITTHGGIFYNDTKVYVIKNNVAKLLAEYEFTLHTADGFDGWHDVRLKMSKNSKQCFEGHVGRVRNLSYDVENFYPKAEGGVVSAPEEVLFFADIDFDGVDELITDLTPFAGSQRDCPAFISIYKLVDGKYQDATDAFIAKCEVFKNIEPRYFMVDKANKQILHYSDGGALSGGWKVYAYADGKYRYDRYVHFDCATEGDMVTITIDYADGAPQKRLSLSSNEFEKRMYTF